jgi:hypothetical protein
MVNGNTPVVDGMAVSGRIVAFVIVSLWCQGKFSGTFLRMDMIY